MENKEEYLFDSDWPEIIDAFRHPEKIVWHEVGIWLLQLVTIISIPFIIIWFIGKM
jgi:hypothetical protein